MWYKCWGFYPGTLAFIGHQQLRTWQSLYRRSMSSRPIWTGRWDTSKQVNSRMPLPQQNTVCHLRNNFKASHHWNITNWWQQWKHNGRNYDWCIHGELFVIHTIQRQNLFKRQKFSRTRTTASLKKSYTISHRKQQSNTIRYKMLF